MRTYDRAEEKRVQTWHAERCVGDYYVDDYRFNGEDLRPFWQALDQYIPEIKADDFRKARLMYSLIKMGMKSPKTVIWQLDW